MWATRSVVQAAPQAKRHIHGRDHRARSQPRINDTVSVRTVIAGSSGATGAGSGAHCVIYPRIYVVVNNCPQRESVALVDRCDILFPELREPFPARP